MNSLLLVLIMLSGLLAFAQNQASVESNEIYEKFMKLGIGSKDQDAQLDLAYHTSGNKVVDVDKNFSEEQKKFVKRSFDIMTKTLSENKKEVADCVKKRLFSSSPNEGSFDSQSSLFTFKDINSRRPDQKKGKLTSEELMTGISNPAGFRLKVVQLIDGGTAVTGLKEAPGMFIIGLGVSKGYLAPQNTPQKKKVWDYAMSGKAGNADMTKASDLKLITDESFLAGVMAHEMAHNYGLDHAPMGGSDFTYVGEFGYCVTLVARRNSVAQKLGIQSGSTRGSGESAGSSGSSSQLTNQ